MFNFLPEKEREDLRSEYKKRRLSVIFVFMALSGLVSLFLFAPTYIVFYLEKEQLIKTLEVVQKDSKHLVDPNFFENIKNISNDVDLLNSHTEEVFVTDLINLVLLSKPELVSITSFAFQKNNNNQELSASLSGFAENREVLLEFSEKLKSKEYITEVNIPLASFTREKNLDFSMQIKGEI